MASKQSRREFIQTTGLALGSVALSGCMNNGKSKPAPSAKVSTPPSDVSQVFMTRNISPDGLLRIHAKLAEQRTLPGKVAVKLHSGEPGGHHFPSPKLITPLVQSLNGTIVECNTAYPGKRFKTADHEKVLREHGFTAIGPVDILDAEGSLSLPVKKGKRLKENFVGVNFPNYDSYLILSHFKGHAMGGFGGAIKNMAIGLAAGEGKMWIHTVGVTRNTDDFELCFKADQDQFLEAIAEAAGSVTDRLGDNILYINLMNNLSIDCDCDSSPAKPELEDIGILASLDAVALDKACVDLVYAADPEKSASLRKRIESKHGTHTLDYAEELGLGRQKYTLVNIDA